MSNMYGEEQTEKEKKPTLIMIYLLVGCGFVSILNRFTWIVLSDWYKSNYILKCRTKRKTTKNRKHTDIFK